MSLGITSTITVTVNGDTHTCAACGKTSDRVRGCCDADDAVSLCDGCYMNPTGLHAGHERRRAKK